MIEELRKITSKSLSGNSDNFKEEVFSLMKCAAYRGEYSVRLIRFNTEFWMLFFQQLKDMGFNIDIKKIIEDTDINLPHRIVIKIGWKKI